MGDEEEYRSDDAKAVKERKQDEKNAQDLELDDLKYLMSLPQFRRFMWHFLSFCNIFGVPPITASEREAGFFDGAKNVGLKYFSSINEHCLDRYTEMAKDVQKKGNRYDD